MAKLFPSKETFVDFRDGTQILTSKVTLLTSTSDHVDLPNAVDAQLLQTDRTTADPTFYLTSKGNQIAIDGGTVGTEYVVVSRHEGMLNFARGRNVTGGNNDL
jgi:hypothetical protein